MTVTWQPWLSDPTVRKTIVLVIGLTLVYVVIRMVQRSVSRYVTDTDIRYRSRKFISLAGYFVGIVFVTTVFSDKLGGLTVAFGVAGAGVAFALQEVIASVAGWVAISFATFYKTGDRIQLGGIKGDVIDIGVLRTTIMECGDWVKGDQYNGRIVRVANSFVFKEAVYNYSADFPFLWDEITIPVKYGCDYKSAREILERVVQEVVGDYVSYAQSAWKQIVAKYRIEDARIEPAVTLIANDNWMEFTVRYVVEFKKRRGTKDRLFTRILEEFDRTNGKVSIASATYQLVEAPVIGVRLINGEGAKG